MVSSTSPSTSATDTKTAAGTREVEAASANLTELAQAAQVTKQTAGFLVDQLERAGYVERAADPSDEP